MDTAERLLRRINDTGLLFKHNMDVDADVANYLAGIESKESAAGRETGREQSHAVSVPTGSADTVPAPAAPTVPEDIDLLLYDLDDCADSVIGGAESIASRSRKMIRALRSLLAQREEKIRELEEQLRSKT